MNKELNFDKKELRQIMKALEETGYASDLLKRITQCYNKRYPKKPKKIYHPFDDVKTNMFGNRIKNFHT